MYRNLMEKGGMEGENVYHKVNLKDLPKYSDLKKEVDRIVESSSWWERYGMDWFVIIMFLLMVPGSCMLAGSESYLLIAVGVFLIGWAHSALANKAGHISSHGGLTEDKRWQRVLCIFFVEVIGSFSEYLAYDIHIKVHHPYTNIIGLGDSSTWKIPFLPSYVYMFLTPLVLPPMVIVISIAGLIEKMAYFELVKYVILCGLGLYGYIYLLMTLGSLSLLGAIGVILLSRGIFMIPYIHVNIFQHIGLPMYSKESKPVRLYQMATGVLNLPRNFILDYAMGHSLINCHVEHHLFPRLSDNMCLKVKPVVSKFLKENGLPYNEMTYMNRLTYFLDKYDVLMVKAPPITHFIGLQ